jgi:hypothetical protein
MPLSATRNALAALKDVLSRTDYTGHRALRLTPDADRKLDFILDTPRENDAIYEHDDVIVLIMDSGLSEELHGHVLDVDDNAEGRVWKLRRGGKGGVRPRRDAD